MGNEVKVIICGMLEKYIDDIMLNHGFKRRKNSIVYSRKVGVSKQKIEMLSSIHPLSNPSALAQIYPWYSVYIPELHEIANEMSGDLTWIKEREFTTRYPIQIRTDSERWLLWEERQADELAVKIGDFFKAYTIPLLDELKCGDDYIKMYEEQDKRIVMDDAFYIFVASAYVQKSDYESGLKVIEKRFGKPGSRKIYASLFQYFEAKIGE